MKPNKKFLNLPHNFWANVRAISETIGYTVRGKNIIRIPTIDEMVHSMKIRTLEKKHLINDSGEPTDLSNLLLEYFTYRAELLNNYVESKLMNVEKAKQEYEKLKKELNPSKNCPLPLNKQKGAKKAEAYLTCMVNMIIEANTNGLPCVYDPRQLTTVTLNQEPLRTLARRIDGAFPSTVNPIAVWEIKEYYYTTTFGSRVADGVYETLLDGMELSELKENENIHVLHYLIIDAYYTWWNCGKSYLCRIVDTMHMGYIDEVLFGYEVIERLPSIINFWISLLSDRKENLK